jgi:hypothetical protein
MLPLFRLLMLGEDNMKKIGFIVLAAGVMSLSATVTYAQGVDCSAVLRDGVFQQSRYRENNYFQQIVYSRFLESTYQISKEDRSAGFGVPVGEIVLGGDYSEAEFNEKKLQIEREYFSQITRTRDIDVALSSGDPEVIGAWRACVTKAGGGLTMRFDAAAPSEIFGYIEYLPQGVQNRARLTSNVTIDAGFKVIDTEGCLRRGKTIVAGNACRFRLAADDQKKPLLAVVNTNVASAQAFLPARIIRVRDIKPYPVSGSDQLNTTAFRTTKNPTNTINLAEQEIKDGWRFDPATARANLYRIYGGGMNGCNNSWSKPGAFTFSYGFTIWGHSRGNDRNWSMQCAMDVGILVIRDRWVGQGTESTMAEGIAERPGFAPLVPATSELSLRDESIRR